LRYLVKTEGESGRNVLRGNRELPHHPKVMVLGQRFLRRVSAPDDKQISASSRDRVMTNSTEICADHPLFREIRNGLLWHRTSADDYRRIQSSGAIIPNDGRIDRWGKSYACQQLGGISLFDFSSEEETRVLGEADKWQQFLGDSDPVTILLGFNRDKFPGRLIPYPQNKEGTTGPVIPWVEVCHCGPIPTPSITSFLLVCSVDYGRFEKLATLDGTTLSLIEKEFGSIVGPERQAQALFGARQREALSRKLRESGWQGRNR
jgi:hypothetical protein